jgi:hypothetical protein
MLVNELFKKNFADFCAMKADFVPANFILYNISDRVWAPAFIYLRIR